MEKKITIAADKSEVDKSLLQAIERGIDDLESHRELPLEKAMQKVREIRGNRKQIRA